MQSSVLVPKSGAPFYHDNLGRMYFGRLFATEIDVENCYDIFSTFHLKSAKNKYGFLSQLSAANYVGSSFISSNVWDDNDAKL